MKTIGEMTPGKSYRCTKQVGKGKDTSFIKGKIYKCVNATPYIYELINEQGTHHPWATQKGCDQFSNIDSAWADNWQDFFTEIN